MTTKPTVKDTIKRKDDIVERRMLNKIMFHARRKAPKQWKKRDKTARYIYNLVVHVGIDLYEQGLYHPKMKIPTEQMEAIVHNIGRIIADEITSLNKFNLTSEIPGIMERVVKYSIDRMKKSKTLKKSKVDIVRKHYAPKPLPKKK